MKALTPRPLVNVRSPLRRQQRLNYLRLVARRAGRCDAAGVLGDHTVAWLRLARASATAAGCLPDDIDDATLDGLDAGRWQLQKD